MKHLRILAFLAPLVLAQPLAAHDYRAGHLSIDHPWSRAVPDGANVAAGYLTVRNEGAQDDRLVSVTAEIAERAEIHEMAVNAEGVMTMRPLGDGIAVPAGGEAALAPGGLHLMFIGLNRRPAEGERFSGTLTFENAGTVEVEFAVERGAGHGHHSH